MKIDKNDQGWPEKLNDLKGQTPKQIWCEGDINILKQSCVCIVGSRRNTEYGKRVVEKLVPWLVEQGKVIVSGFMYGTDQAVHKETLTCGGKTVAVLGWGINYKQLSDEEIKLMWQIEEKGGLVVSEWEEQKGAMWTFPQRDRIMAALATDIFVIEAAMKSGSLITARWGTKLGRTIWAVPGPVTGKVSEGTNWLIGQGLAKIWTPESKICDRDRDIEETEISIALQNEVLSVDELARKLGKSVAEVGAQLSLLELEGKVVERGGKYYPKES